MNELCIRCNKPTPYDIHAPITYRLYYIEGSGQLCEACFYKLYPAAGSFDVTTPMDKEIKNTGE